MRHLKFILVALAFTVSTSIYAFDPGAGEIKEGKAISMEIQKLLDENNLIIEEEFTVKVVFTVSDEKKIQVHSVTSPNEEINEFLHNKLEDRRVYGKKWHQDKFYELPVKVESL